MTASNSVADQVSTIELPRPDGAPAAFGVQIGLLRSLPKVADSGRISFGAGMRLPLSK